MDITKSLLKNQKFQELIKLNEKNDQAHDLNHHLRVKRYALTIASKEGGDKEIIEAAAMLHDIARGLEQTGQITDHLVAGAEISQKILSQIAFQPEKVRSVVYCVLVHQRQSGVDAKTLESKIIQDADLIDAYGLIYAARSILWGLQSKKYKRPLFVDKHIEDFDINKDKNLSTIHYLMSRFQNDKYNISNLHTKIAKEMASRRSHLLQEFVKNFIREWRGET